MPSYCFFLRHKLDTDIWEIQPVCWSTLNKLEISFKYVTNTLQYFGICSHMASGLQNFVHAITLDIG